MAFRSNPSPFTMGDQILTTSAPEAQPYPVTAKNPNPLSDNWSYDSPMGLFNLNPMMPDPFNMDMSDDMMNLESKDFTVDPFSQPHDISGFAITDHSTEDTHSSESMSSDHESEDQRCWSPTYRMVSPVESPVTENMLSRVQTWGPEATTDRTQDPRRKISTASIPTPSTTIPKHHRWSSSPEFIPHDYPATQIPSPVIATSGPIEPTRSSSTSSTATARGRKVSRASPVDASLQQGGGNPRNAAKRAAHNVIEKRYRTNMNAKFLSLEKAMSSDGVAKTTKGGSASLKKSEILTNAVGYIQKLQEENQATQRELALLKQNLLPGGLWRHAKRT